MTANINRLKSRLRLLTCKAGIVADQQLQEDLMLAILKICQCMIFVEFFGSNRLVLYISTCI